MQQNYAYEARASHVRAMIVFTAAVLAIALCGAVAAIAPRPRQGVTPIVHQPTAADVGRIERSAAG
jgi:hypothetical protein